eukprot:6202025-Pleurochrysis_carterae.AAC.2
MKNRMHLARLNRSRQGLTQFMSTPKIAKQLIAAVVEAGKRCQMKLQTYERTFSRQAGVTEFGAHYYCRLKKLFSAHGIARHACHSRLSLFDEEVSYSDPG